MDLKNKIGLYYLPLLMQIIRFGVVGTIASAIHFSIVVSLVELGLFTPLNANIIAFIFAFQASYWGHRTWTFRGTVVYHHVAMTRLLLVACTNLAANQGLFYIFLNYVKLPYIIALLVTLAILPVLTFTLGKFWIFR